MDQYFLENRLNSLHKELQANNRTTLVLGISGGVDSAATLGLLLKLQEKYPNHYEVIPVSCPIHDSEGTTEQTEAKGLAIKLCDHFGIPLRIIPLAMVSRQVSRTLDADTAYLRQQVDYWLRPMAFYKIAMENTNSILVGTTNKSEWLLGWFSQYLDILGINPIIDLYKSEVYQLAELVGVPSFITEVSPKGGLADGSTDEESLGFTYKEFEDYIKHDIGSDELKSLINSRMTSTEFKRNRFNNAFIENISRV